MTISFVVNIVVFINWCLMCMRDTQRNDFYIYCGRPCPVSSHRMLLVYITYIFFFAEYRLFVFAIAISLVARRRRLRRRPKYFAACTKYVACNLKLASFTPFSIVCNRSACLPLCRYARATIHSLYMHHASEFIVVFDALNRPCTIESGVFINKSE